MDTCFCGSRVLYLPVEAVSLGRDPDKTRVCVEKPERENTEANHMGTGNREAPEKDNLIALKSNHCISW